MGWKLDMIQTSFLLQRNFFKICLPCTICYWLSPLIQTMIDTSYCRISIAIRRLPADINHRELLLPCLYWPTSLNLKNKINIFWAASFLASEAVLQSLKRRGAYIQQKTRSSLYQGMDSDIPNWNNVDLVLIASLGVHYSTIWIKS